MYDVYGETCLVKNVYKWAEPKFATISLSQKDSPESGNTLSSKEKVLYAVVSKGHADSLVGYERTYPY